MADQKVEVELAGKSNIDEVVKKAQSSMTNMEKSIEGINKKFKSFGKDLFLSFLGPMVLFNTAINLISESIAKAKQDAKDGLELLSKGETDKVSKQQATSASYFLEQDRIKKENEIIAAGKTELTKRLLTSPENQGLILNESDKRKLASGTSISTLSEDKNIQEQAMKYFMTTPEGKAAKLQEGTAFKAPEGFSNVVGVGANPVMEAMSAQLEQQKRQTELLEIIAAGKASSDPIPELAPPRMISLGF